MCYAWEVKIRVDNFRWGGKLRVIRVSRATQAINQFHRRLCFYQRHHGDYIFSCIARVIHSYVIAIDATNLRPCVLSLEFKKKEWRRKTQLSKNFYIFPHLIFKCSEVKRGFVRNILQDMYIRDSFQIWYKLWIFVMFRYITLKNIFRLGSWRKYWLLTNEFSGGYRSASCRQPIDLFQERLENHLSLIIRVRWFRTRAAATRRTYTCII